MSSSLELIPFRRDLPPAAAARLIQTFQELHQLVPTLPDRMADLSTIIAQLEQMLTICLGVMIVRHWAFTKSVSRALAYSFRLFWEK
jgi:hypothetical protein